jgi:soluble lytic murein transglycosylase-like protein
MGAGSWSNLRGMYRVVISCLALCAGLYGCYTLTTASRLEEPTIWLRATWTPLREARRELAHSLEVLRLREEAHCNRLYTAHLRTERERVASSWKPTAILLRIARQSNPSLSEERASDLTKAIVNSCDRHDIDPLLVAALIAQESKFKPHIVSPGGAVGLGQLLPGTAHRLGVDPYDPAQNIEGCVRYLSRQMKRWRDSPEPEALALASYNAGPGAVEQFRGVPPFRVTQRYVDKVLSRYRQFARESETEKDRWLSAHGPRLRNLF